MVERDPGPDPVDGFVAVGTIDGVVVGYGTVRADDLAAGERIGVIEELYVEPEARGVGVGEAIMDAVDRVVRGRRVRGNGRRRAAG